MKGKIKIAADILMTAALPVLMCYSIVGETAHEVIGTAMFCLFILHHILNFGWIRSLFKGKYDLRRTVGTVVNASVFVCMLGLVYSGIVISRHVFAFVNIGGAMLARTVHMLCAYWGLVLMSLHLGMHISQMAARMKMKRRPLIRALRIVFGMIGAVGIYAFIRLRFADYMFGRVQFAFIDTSASAVLTALQYLTVMVLFAYVGYLLQMLLKKKKNGGSVTGRRFVFHDSTIRQAGFPAIIILIAVRSCARFTASPKPFRAQTPSCIPPEKPYHAAPALPPGQRSTTASRFCCNP